MNGHRQEFDITQAPNNREISFALTDDLRVVASDDPASPVLLRFFSGYDRAFILPDEREELSGFKACLALNGTYRHAFGRVHAELVAIVEDASGTVLGGANFLATTINRGAMQPPASIALNYVYVEAAARGRGLLRIILQAVRMLAARALQLNGTGMQPALFIEQNDPLRLTAEEYAADTAYSGTDQIDRLAIWARLGARVLDFPYIQPPLSAGQHADDGLIYAAIDYPGEGVDRGLLHDHLESFFRISVLKGEVELPAGIAGAQLGALAQCCAPVKLLAIEPAVRWIRAGQPTARFDSFRALAAVAEKEG